jgi:hypothetical protein
MWHRCRHKHTPTKDHTAATARASSKETTLRMILNETAVEALHDTYPSVRKA